MKIFALILGLSISFAAFAVKKKDAIFYVYTDINWNWSEESVNLYDDENLAPEGFDRTQFVLRFKLRPEDVFELTSNVAEVSEAVEVECAYGLPQISVDRDGVRTLEIEVYPYLGLDDGSTCEYTLQAAGKKVSLRYYKEGT